MTLAPLRVAAVQASSVAGDVSANVATAVHLINPVSGVHDGGRNRAIAKPGDPAMPRRDVPVS